TLLVIACPCALVISTPVSIVSAISAAARHGVLVKGGVHLEALARVRVVAFDKTGTLTLGRPALIDAQCTAHAGNVGEPCAACDDVLALAAAVERRSEHPLAAAVVQAAEARSLNGRYATAADVEALAGQGVRGRVNGGSVAVSSHRHIHELDLGHDDAFCSRVQRVEATGQTTMLLHDDQGIRGYLAVADQVRPGSAAAVAGLKAAGIERVVMLTGDNARTAQAIAAQTGIDEVRANLLPGDKVSAVEALLAEHGAVAMVGDGVNDAPALARATVGIAMGGAGSDQALETADIALMGDDLRLLPFVVHLSRQTRRVIMQNVAFSLALKAVFLALALAGMATLWMAVFADVGASLLVILNGMRLLRARPAQTGFDTGQTGFDTAQAGFDTAQTPTQPTATRPTQRAERTHSAGSLISTPPRPPSLHNCTPVGYNECVNSSTSLRRSKNKAPPYDLKLRPHRINPDRFDPSLCARDRIVLSARRV
ncbi:MAG TPA: heavy metal translocating P-type ATPase, partial [Anaerolineae bacterium]|nr:heavy metal translocating P-type ATPase [Anaerolineae bacterium]